MPSKKTSELRTALHAIDDEINGIVRAFDEEDQFLQTFSVKDEEITKESEAKVESIQVNLKTTFEDFEVAEAEAEKDDLRKTLERLVGKDEALKMEKLELVERKTEMTEEEKRLQAELGELQRLRASERAAFKEKVRQLVGAASSLDQEAKKTRTKLTRHVAIELKGPLTSARVSAEELKDANECIRNSYNLIGYLSRGGRDEIRIDGKSFLATPRQ